MNRIWQAFGLKPHLSETFKPAPTRSSSRRYETSWVSTSTRGRGGPCALREREDPGSSPRPHRPDPAAASRAPRAGARTTTSAAAPPTSGRRGDMAAATGHGVMTERHRAIESSSKFLHLASTERARRCSGCTSMVAKVRTEKTPELDRRHLPADRPGGPEPHSRPTSRAWRTMTEATTSAGIDGRAATRWEQVFEHLVRKQIMAVIEPERLDAPSGPIGDTVLPHRAAQDWIRFVLAPTILDEILTQIASIQVRFFNSLLGAPSL